MVLARRVVAQPVPTDACPDFIGDGVRMTFDRFGNPNGQPAGFYTELADTGAPVGSPVLLAPTPRNFHEAPLVAMGADTIALLPTDQAFVGTVERLEVVRLNASGAPLSAPKTITIDSQLFHAYAMARRGPEVVLAWVNGTPRVGRRELGPMSIGLARVAP